MINEGDFRSRKVKCVYKQIYTVFTIYTYTSTKRAKGKNLCITLKIFKTEFNQLRQMLKMNREVDRYKGKGQKRRVVRDLPSSL